MNQEIHTHLEKLKIELSKLEPAVKHLQQADENATALIRTLNTIQKEFSKHLQNIEKSIADANEKHHKQIGREIQESTKKLNGISDNILSSFQNGNKEIKGLLDEYRFLSSETEKLVTKIDSVDFPVRLDKLDSTVSSINQSSQNIQQRLGDIERNIKDDLVSKSKEINSEIDSLKNRTGIQLEAISKQNKLLKTLVFILLVLTVGTIILQVFK